MMYVYGVQRSTNFSGIYDTKMTTEMNRIFWLYVVFLLFYQLRMKPFRTELHNAVWFAYSV